MKTASRKMAPEDIKSTFDVNGMKQTAWDGPDFWALVSHDGTVTIIKQRSGEKSTESIHIPRRVFRQIVAWYQKPQEL